jgi:DNA polymerase IV
MFVPATQETILHADLDAFYASVEQRDDAWLRGRPLIVGTGVGLAESYQPKRAGSERRWP